MHSLNLPLKYAQIIRLTEKLNDIELVEGEIPEFEEIDTPILHKRFEKQVEAKRAAEVIDLTFTKMRNVDALR